MRLFGEDSDRRAGKLRFIQREHVSTLSMTLKCTVSCTWANNFHDATVIHVSVSSADFPRRTPPDWADTGIPGLSSRSPSLSCLYDVLSLLDPPAYMQPCRMSPDCSTGVARVERRFRSLDRRKNLFFYSRQLKLPSSLFPSNRFAVATFQSEEHVRRLVRELEKLQPNANAFGLDTVSLAGR